jgi:hypothetical protein
MPPLLTEMPLAMPPEETISAEITLPDSVPPDSFAPASMTRPPPENVAPLPGRPPGTAPTAVRVPPW